MSAIKVLCTAVAYLGAYGVHCCSQCYCKSIVIEDVGNARVKWVGLDEFENVVPYYSSNDNSDTGQVVPDILSVTQ